jgi:(p)ppGpp synthase/HD superfamily hydrolase
MYRIKLAKQFATEAHGSVGQLRKYTNEPYIVHPAQVAKIVTEIGADKASIAAAWCHDVLEDTKTTPIELLTLLGEDVYGLVRELTDVYTDKSMPRWKRKTLENHRILKISSRAQTIKLADMIANLSDIRHAPDSFAKLYVAEKMATFKFLYKGDVRLKNRLADFFITHETDLQVLVPTQLADAIISNEPTL